MCKLGLIGALVGITLVALLRNLMQKHTHLNFRSHKSNLVVTCSVVPTVWLLLAFFSKHYLKVPHSKTFSGQC